MTLRTGPFRTREEWEKYCEDLEEGRIKNPMDIMNEQAIAEEEAAILRAMEEKKKQLEDTQQRRRKKQGEEEDPFEEDEEKKKKKKRSRGDDKLETVLARPYVDTAPKETEAERVMRELCEMCGAHEDEDRRRSGMYELPNPPVYEVCPPLPRMLDDDAFASDLELEDPAIRAKTIRTRRGRPVKLLTPEEEEAKMARKKRGAPFTNILSKEEVESKEKEDANRRHVAYMPPLEPDRHRSTALADVSPALAQAWKDFSAQAPLVRACALGDSNRFEGVRAFDLDSIHAHQLAKQRAPVHLDNWYLARRERWAEHLVPLEQVYDQQAQRLAKHFASPAWQQVVLGTSGRYQVPNSVLRDATLDMRAQDHLYSRGLYTAKWHPLPLFDACRDISSSHSHALLPFSRADGATEAEEEAELFRNVYCKPLDRKHTFFPERSLPDYPEVCIQSSRDKLEQHGKYLRVRTTMPTIEREHDAEGKSYAVEPSKERYLHASLDDIETWFRDDVIYEELADPIHGPTLSMFRREWVLVESFGNGIWTRGEWQSEERSNAFVSSLLARMMALPLPSPVSDAEARLADANEFWRVPWRDGKPPDGISADELATFAEIHLEKLSLRAARAISSELEERFRVQIEAACPGRVFSQEHVLSNVHAQLQSYVYTRYFRIRRMRAVVSSFSEYLFNPSLWNVVYRPLRVDPMFVSSFVNICKVARKLHVGAQELIGKLSAPPPALPSSYLDNVPRQALVFASHGGAKSSIHLDFRFVKDVRRFLWCADKEERQHFPPEFSSLYALVYNRSLVTFSRARHPDDDKGHTRQGDEVLSDELPECLIHNSIFGAAMPQTEVNWLITENDARGYPQLCARQAQDRTAVWASVAMRPAGYEVLCRSFGQELFFIKDEHDKIWWRKTVPWRHYFVSEPTVVTPRADDITEIPIVKVVDQLFEFMQEHCELSSAKDAVLLGDMAVAIEEFRRVHNILPRWKINVTTLRQNLIPKLHKKGYLRRAKLVPKKDSPLSQWVGTRPMYLIVERFKFSKNKQN